jgi:hypothetical protein
MEKCLFERDCISWLLINVNEYNRLNNEESSEIKTFIR